MPLYDVTVALSPELPVYPGDPEIRVNPWRQLSKGDHANVSQLFLGSHTGTHVDAPSHFIQGARSLDELPPDHFVGPAQVVELYGITSIEPQHLEGLRLSAPRVLFKTRNSGFWKSRTFREDFVYLEPETAVWLVDHGIRVVGIDYLSVEKFRSPEPMTHRILLEKEVGIIEGLDLSAVPAGPYELLCLPLKIRGGDGAPARVLLRS
ncbi:MAG: cyclase family protein [Acidobacteria bacterium]|nr:cyclase family protein [Acidobacteriota bacterium]